MMRRCYRLLRRALNPIERVMLGMLRRVFVLAAGYETGWEKVCPLVAGLYYTLKGTFGYESRATLYGQLMHASDPDGRRWTLRRNIHRVEKGLSMRPRRPAFAEGYIQETVRAFADIAGAGNARDGGLIEWAADVLHEYFGCVGGSSVIAEARDVYEKAVSAGGVNASGRYLPHPREAVACPVTLNDLKVLARQRKSVRWFEQKPVLRGSIDAAIDVARHAPSACNRQPFEFLVVDSPDTLKRVVSVPMGTAGYEHNIPCLVVVIGKQRAFSEERDRHLVYVDAALCAMLFQLALETQGLASCVINWPEIDSRERDLVRVLNLQKDERPIILLAVGVPDPEGWVLCSPRKAVEDLRSYVSDHAAPAEQSAERE